MQLDDGEIIVRRDPNAGKHKLSLLKHIYVEKGSIEDWKQLSELHYKAQNLGIGPRYMRCVLDDGVHPQQTIGVMVFTVPKPLDSGRNEVFPHMRPNRNGGRDSTLINKMRMAYLNKHLILSSRTVLDTMYRGAGIAYRFKNIGYRMLGYKFVESRSSMSRFNPFSIKAGMRFVKPKESSNLVAGLQFFSRHFKSPAYDIAAILAELNAMPEWLRNRVLEEMRLFYYKASSMEKSGDNRLNGMSRINRMDNEYLLKQIMQLVFGATVYAVWKNPDYGRELPPRIPILAFDNQAPDEPLRLDLL